MSLVLALAVFLLSFAVGFLTALYLTPRTIARMRQPELDALARRVSRLRSRR